MKRNPLLRATALAGVMLSTVVLPLPEEMEELFFAREQQDEEKPVIIAQSTLLSESQKKAIQATLHKLFADQMATSGVYNDMVKVLIDGLSDAKVVAGRKHFVKALNDLVTSYFKAIQLSPEQATRMQGMLQAINDLIRAQIQMLKEHSVDVTSEGSSMQALQERLQAHMLPLNNAIETAVSRDAVALYQEGVLELFIGVIKEALRALPVSKNGANKNELGLPEPSIPDHIKVEEAYEYE